MIYVDAPIKQDLIISLLEASTEAHFTYVDKTGIRLRFEVEGVNSEDALKLAKSIIKADTIGASLYIQVSAE